MDSVHFPHTSIGGLAVSRMIMGTNNIMGGSHRTQARDMHIRGLNNNREAVAEMVQTYLSYGVNTIIGCLSPSAFAMEGIRLAEQRSGCKVNIIELAVFDTADNEQARSSARAYIRRCSELGIDICMPLHTCVETLVNKGKGTIDRIGDYLYMIREYGMIPGLSAHMPEIIPFTDANGYDVETYIQIYNAAGFMMQVEVEGIHKIIWEAKKPVLTIKPMAAGHLNPFVGLTFVWNSIRDQDMVAVGCMTPGEVHEVVEYSLAAIDHRRPMVGERLHQY